MATPLEARIDASDRAARSGAVAKSGLESLREALVGNVSGFAEWRGNPMTKVLLKALQHAIVHPPVTLAGDDALVQYGVSQGLVFAFQLFTDPSTLWPDVFAGALPEARKIPDMDFAAPLDEAFA